MMKTNKGKEKGREEKDMRMGNTAMMSSYLLLILIHGSLHRIRFNRQIR